ncbi:translin [Aplysia californica]|uniref:Translin n=1 Tax=Aplysia californica TaxID=6500 RepID=A0ABM0JQ72_APLCA|nr:translin [Aplysia californica]
MASTQDIFTDFQEYLNADHELREEIRVVTRDMNQLVREIQTVLQVIHQPAQGTSMAELCKTAEDMFGKGKELYRQLAEKIPENQYYRYSDMWRFVSQRFVYLAGLIVFLRDGRLVTREEVAALLGVAVQREDGFHIDLDDFLMGLLNMTNELSRLAVNAVTSGDYERPVQISRFVSQLDAGFRVLNLKNDALRKRFDGLKYDVKKCEEVVYDLTIRGLVGAHNKD